MSCLVVSFGHAIVLYGLIGHAMSCMVSFGHAIVLWSYLITQCLVVLFGHTMSCMTKFDDTIQSDK